MFLIDEEKTLVAATYRRSIHKVMRWHGEIGSESNLSRSRNQQFHRALAAAIFI
jgi:hypothetical protein